MATPASRFHPVPEAEHALLPLWLPPDLRPLDEAVADAMAADPVCEGRPAAAPSVDGVDAVEVDRMVPVSGNLAVRPQQFWLGPARPGQTVTLWNRYNPVHLSIDGVRIKTLPSRFSVVDLARLRRGDARPAGPPPAPLAPPGPGVLAGGAVVELDRTVNACGWSHWPATARSGFCWTGRGSPCGWRNTSCTWSPTAGCGAPWPHPSDPRPAAACAVRRSPGHHLSSPTDRSGVHAAGVVARRAPGLRQRLHDGLPHAGQTVTPEVDDTRFRILDQHQSMLAAVPRTNTEEVTRYKATRPHGLGSVKDHLKPNRQTLI
ncbi:hypothetical protein EV644_13921 [Kribbella orskensis]|uniref:Multicopper oxidase n=1 Tax=Kribbella orskensis TaxID=2512216 RepID=A0ABY2B8Y1_9ACTN|nr:MULTISPECIES: hypothetical protein [Kribbella]TCN29261.1 hypothetical protein EV642_14228 [Kribbella sp. VKM Ac-2500]TCO09554.1 hypothetical protein EV644_13921 [Kribbella orskensis]